MADLELFPRSQIAGVFRGFTEGGLEFHADLVLPYRSDFQNLPMHGQFLLVQLETPDEAVLGRICSFSSEGKLASGSGEEFNIRAVREGRSIPDDLRQDYLKYRVNIRVLGVVRRNGNGGLTFVPSHRRLPHVGSPVAFPSGEVLQEIAGHNVRGAQIGHFALGEYIYCGSSSTVGLCDWMQTKTPEICVNFPIESLVSRRSFLFARAGFGKSNLNKLLFSTLYEHTPTVEKRGGKQVPVGTVVFDPDGEYFWPDDKGRPGLCDVPCLEDKLVLFTSRNNPSPFYQSFVAGGIRLDIRRLRPSDVIAIALAPEQQEQQNVRKLKGLNQTSWEELVNLVHKDGNQTLISDIERLLDLHPNQQEAEALAARANMTTIVRMLHDPSSQLIDMLLRSLSEGKLCIIDVSQMRGSQSLVLSGLILRRIFDRNQEEFTKANPKTIPTIAVIEEAQSVLNDKAAAAEPYVAWVKEGRKYDLGALLVTQQPGSIPVEILSQGDNWFIFHLLSAADLMNLRRANAHFSDDLLSVLLNEPIPGQGVFWSSVGGKPYPISMRALSFESMVQPRDPAYNLPAAQTFAVKLRSEFEATLAEAERSSTSVPVSDGGGSSTVSDVEQGSDTIDVLSLYKGNAIDALRRNKDLMAQLEGNGVLWGRLTGFLEENLPASLDDRNSIAFNLVREALTAVLGPEKTSWETFKNDRGKTCIRALRG